MKVYLDADGCPRDVTEIVVRAAARRGFDVVLVANRPVAEARSPRVTSVRVAAGPDAADSWIVEHALPGDLVVTADIPLAARVAEAGAEAMTHRGELLTSDNVGERLSLRNFATEGREAGILSGGGPAPFDAKARRDFANGFDRWITRALGTQGG